MQTKSSQSADSSGAAAGQIEKGRYGRRTSRPLMGGTTNPGTARASRTEHARQAERAYTRLLAVFQYINPLGRSQDRATILPNCGPYPLDLRGSSRAD